MTRLDAQGEHGQVDPAARPSRVHGVPAHRRAFTLIELLVSLAIIAVLVSLLLPAIFSAITIARARQCQAGQRAVGFDFFVFGDEELHSFRGSDASPTLFSLSSFIDAQYRVNEFWAWGSEDEVVMPDADGHDPMRCPEVVGPVTLTRGRQATAGGVGPSERLSFGFNIRLQQAEVRIGNGPPRAQAIRLNSGVVGLSNVPLMWDIDAVEAGERGFNPLLSGPSAGNTGIFSGDRYWFPGLRHHGKGNFLFADGHVAESGAPLSEPGWNWGYTPPTR